MRSAPIVEMNNPRFPWDAFPPVWIHGAELAVKRHLAYAAAKAGDPDAAFQLVKDHLSALIVNELMQVFRGRNPILVSAHAVEGTGVNAIPEALADVLAQRLGWRVDSGVVQINIVGHTGANGFSRLARQAMFDGPVTAGERYVLRRLCGSRRNACEFARAYHVWRRDSGWCDGLDGQELFRKPVVNDGDS